MTTNYDSLTDTEWRELIIAEIDALPEEQDFADVATLAELDAVEGAYSPPHWSSANFDEYIKCHNDAWAARNGKVLTR